MSSSHNTAYGLACRFCRIPTSRPSGDWPRLLASSQNPPSKSSQAATNSQDLDLALPDPLRRALISTWLGCVGEGYLAFRSGLSEQLPGAAAPEEQFPVAQLVPAAAAD